MAMQVPEAIRVLLASFIVQGEPVPKQSFRYAKKGGYQPARVKAWQELVGWEAKMAMREPEPSRAELFVDIAFWRRSNRRADLDNLAKPVLDAMKGIVFEDDAQIVRLRLEKKPCDGLEPRVCVRVWEVE
ncbi:MAG: RusA family crossover junction endodeoxyribonuclease [Methyloceanibacter sp.]|nr:RusA family crossover junction endodeoxyribonuclease [Methyloceanibacter sp.]